MSSISVARHRVRQGVAAILTRSSPRNDGLVDDWLTPNQRDVFRRMSSHDRAHSERVARRLLADGQPNRELIAAALLHDIAKAGTAALPGRIRLPDRVLRVLLGRVAPDALHWLTSGPDRRGCRGLYLAVHHARLGAATAHTAGCSARTVWLIANHEDASNDDPQLRALVAADDASH